MSKYINAVVISMLAPSAALAANNIQVGTLVVDPPTLCCLGVSVPVTGDDNFNAQAQIEYRVQGGSTWLNAMPLMRVRTDTLTTEDPAGDYGLPDPIPQFAGSVFGLAANTLYEVRVTIADPDGGGGVQTATARTRSQPLSTPATPRAITVATKAALDSALSSAQPGDVITVAAGTYAGGITINRSGTATNPIIVRGVDAATVTLNAAGASYGVVVNGDHVYVENLTVQGSGWGAYAADTRGVVIQRNRFTSVDMGIDARSGSTLDLYICDNRLEGKFLWPDVSSATWNAEGIAVGGQGNVVCFNTLSGFGDALGLSHLTDIINLAIDFYGNDVLWTGDDGIELDFAHRNVRAFNNRLSNTSMGVSLQPVWGGPVYFFRNVLVNAANSPYKLNNEPTGFYILNNTSIRTLDHRPGSAFGGFAIAQLGYDIGGHTSYVSNFVFKNNILIGKSAPAKFTSQPRLAEIDYNGWSPDGTFMYFNSTYAGLTQLKASATYDVHSVVLSGQTFQTALVLPANYTTPWTDTDVRLLSTSNAIDAGAVLPNVTDAFLGGAPDLGAIEFGSAAPIYGVRPRPDTMPPAAPTGVQVN